MNPLDRRPLRIGLTGGIGSGKSTVAAILVDMGCVLIDTDAIARRLTEAGGAALPAIAQAFGPEMLDATGALDRERMRSRVFADAAQRKRLEAILHPMIGAESDTEAQTAGQHSLVFDVPLLAESARWRKRVDRILVVDCSEATQAERVMQRSGWSREVVERVIAQQAPRSARRAIADAVVNNEGLDLSQLRGEVSALCVLWDLRATAT
ncbi:MAG TPA: dephospho-CoA kinase [Burkholderiaceae bacterium]|nr:dephospho-CoA kinase [Burkholderiaceae bacterium]